MEIKTVPPNFNNVRDEGYKFKLLGQDGYDPFEPETLWPIEDNMTLPIAFEPETPNYSSEMVGGLLVAREMRATIESFARYVQNELKKESPQPPILLKGKTGTQYAVSPDKLTIKTDHFIVDKIISFESYLAQFLKPVQGWESWEQVIERGGVTPGSESAPEERDTDWEGDEDDDRDWELDDDEDTW